MISFTPILSAVYGACASLALALPSEFAQPVSVAIVPHLVRIDAGGDAVIVRFSIDPGWHLFWTNPGESGVAPSVKLVLPEGWTAAQPSFPRPQVFETGGERNFGYETSLDLIVPVKRSPLSKSSSDAASDSIAVSASVSWMACKSSCVMGKSELALTVATTTAPLPPPKVTRAYPTKFPKGFAACIENGSPHVLVVTAPVALLAAKDARFIPHPVAGVEFRGGTGPFTFTQTGDLITMRAPLQLHPGDAVEGPMRICGLLLVGDRESSPVYEIDLAPLDGPVSAP